MYISLKQKITPLNSLVQVGCVFEAYIDFALDPLISFFIFADGDYIPLGNIHKEKLVPIYSDSNHSIMHALCDSIQISI